ncbi:hypothetical protein FH972_021720 [Carpinus fangiana]|uniref:Nucleoside phosphorylase domain-containing protein n=1 Tax=Carpinus fangiana TaxID=176857 RepID=A0A5N6KQ62_9ROSI|nr:hypothetical protein FH972_021720 [Carpinus fangiana]
MHREDYTVALICALPEEQIAALAILDENHADLPPLPQDPNIYSLGRIQDHNTVIAYLPAGVMGTVSAAVVVSCLRFSFPKIATTVMIGIAGGVPGSSQTDLRLGDVVVSTPSDGFGGIVQYDFGKTIQDGKFHRTGQVNRPPDALLLGVAKLRASHMMHGHTLDNIITGALQSFPRMQPRFSCPGPANDILFEGEYDHPEKRPTCDQCDLTRLKKRGPRSEQGPVVHYGLIASGNQLMRHGATRDKLCDELNVLCFEMEAAGLAHFPCLVVRGICDYADSHKNKQWQPYAALAAAAYVKELLHVIPAAMGMESRSADSSLTTQEKIVDEQQYAHSRLLPQPYAGSNVPETDHDAIYQATSPVPSCLPYIPPNDQQVTNDGDQANSNGGQALLKGMKSMFLGAGATSSQLQETIIRPPGQRTSTSSLLVDRAGGIHFRIQNRGSGTYIIVITRPESGEPVPIGFGAYVQALVNNMPVRVITFGALETEGRPYANTLIWHLLPDRPCQLFHVILRTGLPLQRIEVTLYCAPLGTALPEGPGWSGLSC